MTYASHYVLFLLPKVSLIVCNNFEISVKFKRNRSLTKEEIDAYWKSKRKLEEEHLRAISLPVDRYDREKVGIDYKRSSSFPPARDVAVESKFVENKLDRKNLEELEKVGW